MVPGLKLRFDNDGDEQVVQIHNAVNFKGLSQIFGGDDLDADDFDRVADRIVSRVGDGLVAEQLRARAREAHREATERADKFRQRALVRRQQPQVLSDEVLAKLAHSRKLREEEEEKRAKERAQAKAKIARAKAKVAKVIERQRRELAEVRARHAQEVEVASKPKQPRTVGQFYLTEKGRELLAELEALEVPAVALEVPAKPLSDAELCRKALIEKCPVLSDCDYLPLYAGCRRVGIRYRIKREGKRLGKWLQGHLMGVSRDGDGFSVCIRNARSNRALHPINAVSIAEFRPY